MIGNISSIGTTGLGRTAYWYADLFKPQAPVQTVTEEKES